MNEIIVDLLILLIIGIVILLSDKKALERKLKKK